MYKINSIDRKAYIYHSIPFIKLNENRGEKNRKTGKERREEEREGRREKGWRERGRAEEGEDQVPLDSVPRNLHSSTQITTGFVFSIWVQFIQIIAT